MVDPFKVDCWMKYEYGGRRLPGELTIAVAEALELWLQRYTEFVVTKNGLAAALHPGDPAYNSLHGYFNDHVGPALRMLLDNAVAAGVVHAGEDPLELLGAVANLSVPPRGATDNSCAYRMVALMMNGMRFGAARAS